MAVILVVVVIVFFVVVPIPALVASLLRLSDSGEEFLLPLVIVIFDFSDSDGISVHSFDRHDHAEFAEDETGDARAPAQHEILDQGEKEVQLHAAHAAEGEIGVAIVHQPRRRHQLRGEKERRIRTMETERQPGWCLLGKWDGMVETCLKMYTVHCLMIYMRLRIVPRMALFKCRSIGKAQLVHDRPTGPLTYG